MGKRVVLTDKMMNQIRAKSGQDVDFSKIVFYQARGLSTEPISQNTIYDKGNLTREALSEMVQMINDPLNSVTLQTMHEDQYLPVGKVYYSELIDEPNTGHAAIYPLFGVSVQHPDLIDKIDNGIIDEVSFGFKPKQILCSKCGKDFMDDDVDFMAFWDCTCPECGAVMGGKEGEHVIVPHIEVVRELSLVGRGAAKHAKILDNIYQMAMSDKSSPEIVLTKDKVKKDLIDLNLCLTIDNKEVKMNPEELKAAVLAATEPLSKEVKDMTVSLASLGEEKKALEAAKTALEAEKASLSEEKAALEAELAESKKEVERLQSVEASFDEEVKKVLVAAGLSDNMPKDLEGKKELLNKSHLILAAIPVNGVADKADRLKKEADKTEFSAYKVK